MAVMSVGPKSKTAPGLTERQKDFARYYLQFAADPGAGPKAYRLAFNAGRMTPGGVSSCAQELLNRPLMRSYIAERREAKEFRCDVTAAQVLDRVWRIATADPNKIIKHRRVCCRRCYGIGFEYQYKDEAEYARACEFELREAEREKRSAALPAYGGVGFNHILAPHPQCPHCRGEGLGDVLIADTDLLEGAERLLYRGVEVKPNGAIKILMHDQGHFIELVMRHLGMFNDRAPGAANGNPLAPAMLINAKTPKDAAAIYTRLMNAI